MLGSARDSLVRALLACHDDALVARHPNHDPPCVGQVGAKVGDRVGLTIDGAEAQPVAVAPGMARHAIIWL